MSFTVGLRAALAASIASFAGIASPTAAETLRDALVEAYARNPTLNQLRAEQRATDELVPQAKTGLRPSVGLSLSGLYNRIYNDQSFLTLPESNTGTAQLVVTQPLYTGGRTSAQVRAAESTVYAGREGLRASEAQVLTAVVQAYEAVRRDVQTIEVLQTDLQYLQHQLDETRARQKVGDLTKTDVSQAEVQLLDSRSTMAEAQGQLEIDRATYLAVVGHRPGALEQEAPLPGLPKTVDDAFGLVEQNNPILTEARRTAESSKAKVDAAKAANRPTVTLQGTFGADGTLLPAYASGFERTVQGEVVLSQPLFTGGENESLIRQAKAQANADQIGIEVARRGAIQAAAQAWSEMLASQRDAAIRRDEVVASKSELEGQQQEYRAGLRSTLEVLIAEQNWRQARLAEINALSQTFQSQVGVLAAIGRLEIRYVAPDAPLYDPATSYRKVENAGGVPWDRALRTLDRTLPIP
jgi:outer membrane protein